MRTSRPLLAACFALLCVLAAPGCAPRIESYPSLYNQGLLPLSTSTPYVGANVFLAEEAQRSAYLHNFLKGRGGPAAIELIAAGSSRKLLMFYPRDREVFAADLEERKLSEVRTFREWIVRGPYAIERRDYQALARLESAFAGEPVFMIHGKVQRFRFDRPQTQRATVIPALPDPTPTPKPRKTTVIKSGGESKPAPAVTPPAVFTPLNSDQQALMIAKGYAERAANGDVLHNVKGAAETLSAVAKWYTGSSANAEALAAVNPEIRAEVLTPGTRVRVPFALVRETKAMPTDFK